MKHILALFLCLTPAAALAVTRTPIVFECSCEDTVGRAFARAFRDVLATSPRYEQAYIAEPRDSTGKQTGVMLWKVNAVSVDQDVRGTGQSAAISIVLLIGDYMYETHQIETCGSAKG
jgi:hypothetical protein